MSSHFLTPIDNLQTTPPSSPVKLDFFDQLSTEMHQNNTENGYSSASSIAPASPSPSKFIISILPSAPRQTKNSSMTSEMLQVWKREQEVEDTTHFENPIPLYPEENQQLKQLSPPNTLSFSQMYRSNDGTPYSVLKQTSFKGCGPTSLLMLWSDLHRNSETLPPINERFWEILNRCHGANEEKVLDCAKNLLAMHLKKQQNITTVDQIQELLESSGHPVLGSIMHPSLYGHWVVIDSVNNEPNGQTIDVRDPYTGKAYRVQPADVQLWFSDDTGTCLYVAQDETT